MRREMTLLLVLCTFAGHATAGNGVNLQNRKGLYDGWCTNGDSCSIFYKDGNMSGLYVACYHPDVNFGEMGQGVNCVFRGKDLSVDTDHRKNEEAWQMKGFPWNKPLFFLCRTTFYEDGALKSEEERAYVGASERNWPCGVSTFYYPSGYVKERQYYTLTGRKVKECLYEDGTGILTDVRHYEVEELFEGVYVSKCVAPFMGCRGGGGYVFEYSDDSKMDIVLTDFRVARDVFLVLTDWHVNSQPCYICHVTTFYKGSGAVASEGDLTFSFPYYEPVADQLWAFAPFHQYGKWVYYDKDGAVLRTRDFDTVEPLDIIP